MAQKLQALEVIRETVAIGANNQELEMFLYLSKTYGLDPFLKEIWYVKDKQTNKGIIMTARDGYLKIAHRNKHFKGIKSDYVCKKDKFVVNNLRGIAHEYSTDRGDLIGAYAIVYRDDFMPTYVYAPLSEYYKDNSKAWRQYTSAMIKKVAEAMALKRAFAISGLVTREEMGYDEARLSATTVEVENPKIAKDKEALGLAYHEAERQLDLFLKLDKPHAVKWLWNKYLEFYNDEDIARRQMQDIAPGASKDWDEGELTELFVYIKKQDVAWRTTAEEDIVIDPDLPEELRSNTPLTLQDVKNTLITECGGELIYERRNDTNEGETDITESGTM